MPVIIACYIAAYLAVGALIAVAVLRCDPPLRADILRDEDEGWVLFAILIWPLCLVGLVGVLGFWFLRHCVTAVAKGTWDY